MVMTARGAWGQSEPLVVFRVTKDRIDEPLGGRTGDATRGRDVVLNRNEGGCLLCHAVPAVEGDERTRFMGNLAPPLSGVGARLAPAQIRLRLVDPTLVNPQTIMPPYYRVDGLNQVASAFRGRTVLGAQQIEDAVAWLSTLR
jgi:L-cysteine S-thiosulfotransferase